MTMDSAPRRYILRSLALVLAVLSIGTIGYHFLEHLKWLDSLYMTVITVTTVGFREVHTLSLRGKIFTIFIIFGGVGTIFFFANNLIQYTIESEIYGSIRQRRLLKKLKELKGHYIICGFGRVGSHVAEELAKAGVPFVVLDTSLEAVSLARTMGYLAIEGDATLEETLSAAGGERARGLIACLPSDALNLYSILTARFINPQLYIVTRIEHEEVEERFRKIGVNRVVSLHSTAGRHMARLALNPFIENTMDISIGPQLKLTVEQVEVLPSSPFAQKTVDEINKACGETTIIALKKGMDILWKPPASTKVEENDILIVAGPSESLFTLMGTPEICEFKGKEKAPYAE